MPAAILLQQQNLHLIGLPHGLGQIEADASAVKLNSLNTWLRGIPYAFSIACSAWLPGKRRYSVCNSVNSSAISSGKKSRRVDKNCPALIKIGPKSSSAKRIR